MQHAINSVPFVGLHMSLVCVSFVALWKSFDESYGRVSLSRRMFLAVSLWLQCIMSLCSYLQAGCRVVCYPCFEQIWINWLQTSHFSRLSHRAPLQPETNHVGSRQNMEVSHFSCLLLPFLPNIEWQINSAWIDWDSTWCHSGNSVSLLCQPMSEKLVCSCKCCVARQLWSRKMNIGVIYIYTVYITGSLILSVNVNLLFIKYLGAKKEKYSHGQLHEYKLNSIRPVVFYQTPPMPQGILLAHPSSFITSSRYSPPFLRRPAILYPSDNKLMMEQTDLDSCWLLCCRCMTTGLSPDPRRGWAHT